MWQPILFTMLSFGLWPLYWIYKIRQQTSHILERSDDSVLMVILYFIPIVQFYVLYSVWDGISQVGRLADRPTVNAANYTLIFFLCYLTGVIFILPILGIPILFVITQERHNDALNTLAGGVAPERGVSFWSLFWVAMPWLFTMLFVLLVVALEA